MPDPLTDTLPHPRTPGAFAAPPGSIPLGEAPSGVISEPPGASVNPRPEPAVAAPVETTRRGLGIGWFAVVFYGVTLLLVALMVPAWLSTLGQKGIDANIQSQFGPSDDAAFANFIKRIQGAERELMIAARFVNNQDILQAILDRQRNGVSVLLLLTRDEESSAKTASWLISNGFPQSHLFFDAQPLTSQLVLIDQQTVITGNLPFNARMSSSSGELLVMKNPRLAAEYRNHLEARVRASIAIP